MSAGSDQSPRFQFSQLGCYDHPRPHAGRGRRRLPNLVDQPLRIMERDQQQLSPYLSSVVELEFDVIPQCGAEVGQTTKPAPLFSSFVSLL
jgi:hypothetical protein